MDCRLILTLLLLLSSWLFVGTSESQEPQANLKSLGDSLAQSLQGVLNQQQAEGAAQAGGAANSMPCMQKLLPCQPFLHSPSPPPTCCTPLKDMVLNDSKCLCTIFNNPDFLKSLNLTKDDALNLPKACGAKPDVSICSNATSPTSSPATTSTPSSDKGTDSSSPSSSNSSNNSTTKSAAHVGGLSLIASSVGLIVSVF